MSSSSNQAENGHKYFFLLDFTFTFHAGTWYFPPPYLQGVPNAKNSHLYSRLMFLQSNAEHISRLQGKTRGGEREGAKKKSRGGRHKGLSYFLCHLLASTFTAIPLHHVKDCKQENNNSVSETTERVQHPLSWRSLCHQLGREKTFVFIVHLNNIYLSL